MGLVIKHARVTATYSMFRYLPFTFEKADRAGRGSVNFYNRHAVTTSGMFRVGAHGKVCPEAVYFLVVRRQAVRL